MKAVRIDGTTPASQIGITEVPIPEIKPGWVLIKVKAFGLNHSEQILRLEEIEESHIKKPVIPGIECVGTVFDGGDTRFRKGDAVAALMGGMGRSFDGSYAEYTLMPEHHVFKIYTQFSWEEMAAVPETYFTAWESLVDSLCIRPDDTLLIRGATCALGYAAIQLAKALGCKVIATTHRESKLPFLMDADEALLDNGTLNGKLSCVTKALELVGPKTLSDTLKAVDKGAIVCATGVLGGEYTLEHFDPIKDIPNGVYLTGFFSNYPSQEKINEIFDFLRAYDMKPHIGAVYSFDDIRQACMDMDSGVVNGKIVIKL